LIVRGLSHRFERRGGKYTNPPPAFNAPTFSALFDHGIRSRGPSIPRRAPARPKHHEGFEILSRGPPERAAGEDPTDLCARERPTRPGVLGRAATDHAGRGASERASAEAPASADWSLNDSALGSAEGAVVE